MSRGSVWRAAPVTEADVGSVEWFGRIDCLFTRRAILFNQQGRREDFNLPIISLTQ
jgi:hypothetical protein